MIIKSKSGVRLIPLLFSLRRARINTRKCGIQIFALKTADVSSPCTVTWITFGLFSSTMRCPGSCVPIPQSLFWMILTLIYDIDLCLRRPNDPYLEQHLPAMHRRLDWPFALCHVRPVPSQRRSHRLCFNGSDCSGLGYLWSPQSTQRRAPKSWSR